MKVNIFTMPTVPASVEERERLRPIGRNPAKYQEMLSELEAIAKICDELGYYGFSTTEHHFHTEGGEALPNTLLLYAKLATLTERLAFIPLSMVLPAGDPIRIAEDMALFDNMFPGRGGVCFARGYQKRWLQVLAQKANTTSLVDPESDRINREIFDEYLEIILKAWGEDVFDYDGKYYQVPFPHDKGIEGWAGVDWTRKFGADGEIDDDGIIRKIGVVPKPVTEGGPPVFIPFTLSPKTLTDTARRGMIPLIAHSQHDKFLEYSKTYQRVSAENGFERQLGQNLGAVRSFAIGESYDEAFEICVKTTAYEYHNYFNKFGMGEFFRTPEDPPDQMVQFKDEEDGARRLIDSGMVLFGTVDEVKEQVADLNRCHQTEEPAGLEWLILNHFAQGTVPHEVGNRQLRLFAEQVMPAFQ